MSLALRNEILFDGIDFVLEMLEEATRHMDIAPIGVNKGCGHEVEEVVVQRAAFE